MIHGSRTSQDLPRHGVRLPRLRHAFLVVLVGTAAFTLHTLFAPEARDGADLQVDAEEEFHRRLATTKMAIFGDEALLALGDGAGSQRHQHAAAAAGAETDVAETDVITPHVQLVGTGLPFPPYDLADAAAAAGLYETGFALMVYDPARDEFVGAYSLRNYVVASHKKLMKSIRLFAYVLRRVFPERFAGKDSPELVIPISAGDDPAVRIKCLEHFRNAATADTPLTPQEWKVKMATHERCSKNAAPILHFGSVFREEHLFPNMMGMPMPGYSGFLDCFTEWAHKKTVCASWQARTVEGNHGLVYGEEFGLAWEDLLPQVVWRGTDYPYLTELYPIHHSQPTRRLADGTDVAARHRDRQAAVVSLRAQYDGLLPRWQAVVLTAEAEIEAEIEAEAQIEAAAVGDRSALPWANMKVSRFNDHGWKPAVGAARYSKWDSVGFATGEYMGVRDLATHRYQIDLGGGGGTTWSGTLEKLAMPGLLFHHLTPTKDFIHDWMTPWVHYVPVASDLSDLKEKVAWAEGHQEEAKTIADAGTALVRHLTSPEGMEEMFQREMVAPLRSVLEAYQPLEEGELWQAALDRIEGEDVVFPVISCSGKRITGCKQLRGLKSLMSGVMKKRNWKHSKYN